MTEKKRIVVASAHAAYKRLFAILPGYDLRFVETLAEAQSALKADNFSLIMMLTRLLVAKAESGDYSLDDKQFYEKLRAVAIEENNNYARPFAAAAAINKRMRRCKQFKALKLIEAYGLINEKYEKIGQS